MASIDHKNITVAEIHIPHNWSYADATARLAATGFAAADVTKLAFQESDGTFWVLTDDAPITWQQATFVVGTGSGQVAAGNHNHTGTYQPLDSDLTTIAGLTATTDNFMQAKAGAWASRTPTQVTADLIAMVGDSGSGGTKGLAPARGAGDAAALKFLKADGTWAVPAGTGMSNPMTTQDDLIVGGASGTPARLAKGSDGQVLTVDPTTHHLVWATPASGGMSDPMTTAGDLIIRNAGNTTARLGVPSPGPNGRRLGVASGVPAWLDELSAECRLWDDFIGGSLTSGQVGAQGWSFNGGGPTIAFQAAEAGHPGIIRRGTAASTNNVAVLGLQSSAGASVTTMLPAENFDLLFVIRLNNNDSDTTIQIGLLDSYSVVAITSGIYIEKAAADTSYYGVTRSGGSQTRTAALLATDTNFHKFRIRRKDASTISFSIDGGAEVDATATIPTAGIFPGVTIKTAVNTAKTFDIDAFALVITGLSR